MRNPFLRILPFFASLVANQPVKGKEYTGELIPENPGRKMKIEQTPESIRERKRIENEARKAESIALKMEKQGIQRFEYSTGVIYARNQRNADRKYNNSLKQVLEEFNS